MLNKRQIENNIKWLLTYGSPPVSYLTRRDLLKNDPASKEMKEQWTRVEKCDLAQDIFSKQEADGSWCAGGSWALPPPYLPKGGYTPVSPKYVTTAWILPVLGDMGFTIRDKRIDKACEYILSFQCKNGFVGERKDVDKYDVRLQNPCRFAATAIGLGKVGMGSDPRVTRAYDLLVKWQRDDGGWVFGEHFKKRNWSRSCPWSTYHATMALYSSNNAAYREVLIRALEFLTWHLSTKEDDDIRRFFYHGHSTVHELLMFSEFNIGLKEKAVQTILEWLMSMYRRDEGCYRYVGKPISKYSRRRDYMDARVAKYRLHHLVEDDWLTYYMTRIVSHILKHKRLL